MITVMLRTADHAWTARCARPGPEAGTAVIDIPESAVTRETFAGVPVLGFDLQALAGSLPREVLNRYQAVVPGHVLHDPAGEADRAAWSASRAAHR